MMQRNEHFQNGAGEAHDGIFRMAPDKKSIQVPLWTHAKDLFGTAEERHPRTWYVDEPHEYNEDEEPEETLRREKVSEAKTRADKTGQTLYESIKNEGVRNPVTVATDVHDGQVYPGIIGGHHRGFVAHDIHPDTMIPLRYDSEIETAGHWCSNCGGTGSERAIARVKNEQIPEIGQKLAHHDWHIQGIYSAGKRAKFEVYNHHGPDSDSPGYGVVMGKRECKDCGGTGVETFTPDK